MYSKVRKKVALKVLVTGGTFDKEYDEITGKLYFKETHMKEILRLGRSQANVCVKKLMLMDSLDMKNADRDLILKNCKNSDVIGIDEAQFFDLDLISICKKLAKKGKRVVVAGLEKDFQAIPFGPMPQLLVDAEYVMKVSAICMKCGDPANFSQRISSEKNQVVIGEIDKYEPRCRNCFEI